MNLPNKLTIFRIILTVIVITILLFPFYEINLSFPKYVINNIVVDSKYFIAGIIFIIASITDFLDGYIARKYNLITDFGKTMDSIADKILTNSILIILASANFISPLIAVIIIMRDIAVDSIKMLSAGKGHVVAAINTGKVKAACLMIGIVLTLFYNMPFEFWNIKMADLLLISATILSVISGFQYFYMNKKLFNMKKNSHIEEIMEI